DRIARVDRLSCHCPVCGQDGKRTPRLNLLQTEAMAMNSIVLKGYISMEEAGSCKYTEYVVNYS
ncbi:MAG: hypothetical protein KAS83_02425, partial [Dehalococcoidia bacterium]|nr:hypothetical protein [Dehalococcoidia bacterium]